MTWLMVAMGGALGAMARYGLSLAMANQALLMFGNTSAGRFPWGTLLCNVLGCLMAAFLYVAIMERHWLPESWRPLLMVGFCGALTTFSTWSLELYQMLEAQQWWAALLYWFVSISAGLISMGLVIFLAREW